MKKYIIIILICIISLLVFSCLTNNDEPEPNPVLYINPTNINLGTHTADHTFSSSFIVKNTGGGTLKVNDITENIDWITSLSPTSFNLTANQQKTIHFSGKFPITSGSFNSNININSNVSDKHVYVHGVVSESDPELYIYTTDIDLGTHPADYSFSSSFIVKNTGGGTLEVDDITENVDWITSLSPTSFDLTANQQKTIYFSGQFPITPESFNTNININSNVGDDNVYVHGVISPKLYFSETEYSVSLGSYVEITIKIDNVESLFASSMIIKYDTSVVEYRDGSLVSGNFWSGNLVEMSIEDENGLNVCIGLIQSSGIDGITGSGDLFSFQLKGKSANEASLEIESVNLIDEDGNYINNFDNLEITNSMVVVN